MVSLVTPPTPDEAAEQFFAAMKEIRQVMVAGLDAAGEAIDGLEDASAHVTTAWGFVGDVSIAPKTAADVSAAMLTARAHVAAVRQLTGTSADALEGLVHRLHEVAKAEIDRTL